jgi:hypothetical protein
MLYDNISKRDSARTTSQASTLLVMLPQRPCLTQFVWWSSSDTFELATALNTAPNFLRKERLRNPESSYFCLMAAMVACFYPFKITCNVARS